MSCRSATPSLSCGQEPVSPSLEVLAEPDNGVHADLIDELVLVADSKGVQGVLGIINFEVQTFELVISAPKKPAD